MRKVSSTCSDPRTRKEALTDNEFEWKGAEAKDIKNHEVNESWSYISRDNIPLGRRLVRLIWVYKKKRDGSYKARLCVQGCSQVAGVDYHQTF